MESRQDAEYFPLRIRLAEKYGDFHVCDSNHGTLSYFSIKGGGQRETVVNFKIGRLEKFQSEH